PQAARIEPGTMIRARVTAFQSWLANLPVRCVAVVGHGGFFNYMIGLRLDDCAFLTLWLSPSDKGGWGACGLSAWNDKPSPDPRGRESSVPQRSACP
ncbi:MAG: hypothetical protein FD153_766, partial [Rhodospirillaceae bacterium]